MTIKVTCRTCLTVFEFPDFKGGRQIRCRECGRPIKFPGEPVKGVEGVLDGCELGPRFRGLRRRIQKRPIQEKSIPLSFILGGGAGVLFLLFGGLACGIYWFYSRPANTLDKVAEGRNRDGQA